MIVSQVFNRIDGILANMQANHSRILASFKLQSSKGFKLSKKPIMNMSRQSQKGNSMRDSTFAESKQKYEKQIQNKMHIKKQDKQFHHTYEGIDNLNQIMQDSQQQVLSFDQQQNPLKNFISPTSNWNVTNSRNQHKSMNFDIQIQPQCASFQHVDEQDSNQ